MNLENNCEIVISGVGGLFPECKNIEEFKQRLLNNDNLMGSRWKEGEMGVTNVIGTVSRFEKFDASYFGIHFEQSLFMNSMQRMALETTFEALVDAGVNPVDLKGKKIGVYAGSSLGENDNLFYELVFSGFGIIGTSRTMLPNRVSYWLNLKGPSCAYDSNWLGGIEALQAAYEVVRRGECEAAIAITTNLLLNSEMSWLYNDMGLLSPDGTTRAFDANATGYGRSDGIIALYIQRACDAKRTYATILGVNSRFSGNRDGPFREVNEDDMSNFIQEFYNDCKVDPRDVEFVECYGCGLSIVDEAELNAIDKVYCKSRERPLFVGSVKSNAGHSEASAIFTSLAKVLVAMESGIIPANLNYVSPNPKIDSLVKGRIEVVAKNREWNSGLAAINGVGVGSSYGHILLKGNLKPKAKQLDNLPRLINVSSRTEEGIQSILTSLSTERKVEIEHVGLIHTVFKKSFPGHLYKGYAIIDGSEEVKKDFQCHVGNKRQIWFVYSGMGSQWCKMATDLMALPIFAEAIHKCHKVLKPKGIDLLTIVTGDDPKMFENILHSFVGIAAVQIGLTDILRSIGIVPDGIIGHSVGELGCAYADGCLSAEQMILCAYSRGRASLEANLIRGMMAAVGMSYLEIKDQCPSSIEVACHNSLDSCTISGPAEDMEHFVKALSDTGIFARFVNVSNIAYHSRYIKPAAPILLKYLQEFIPKPLPRSPKWISTSVPENRWDTDLAKTSSAEYHTNNLLSPVLFEEGLKHIPKAAVVIEIAPHGLLQAILRRSLSDNVNNISLTHKSSKNGLHFLLEALGKLYLAGLDLDISVLYPKIEYPVGRGTKSLTTLIHWEHSESWRSGLEDKFCYLGSTRGFDISLKQEEYRELVGHQLLNLVIIPTSTYLAMVFEILNRIQVTAVTEVVFENLRFTNVVRVSKLGSVSVCIMVQKGSGCFEISSGNNLIGSGRVSSLENEKLFADVTEIEIPEDCAKLTENEVYTEFSHRNHKYEGAYKCIKTLHLVKEGSVGIITWNNKWHFVEAMIQQCLFLKGERKQDTLIVSSIQRIVVSLSNLPVQPSDEKVTYNYATGVVSNSRIQIFGIGVEPLRHLDENRSLAYNAIELRPLFQGRYECIESVINLGLQVTVENFHCELFNNTMIVEIQKANTLLENNIKNVINKNLHLNPRFSTALDSTEILISHIQPVYVIINNVPDKNCINLVTSSHVFLLAHTDSNTLANPEITQVAEFIVDDVSYSLLRKSTNTTPIIVSIESGILTSQDFLLENLPWVMQLKSAIASSKGQRIYLVSTVVPVEGIYNFFRNAIVLPGTQDVRFVFILDKEAIKFTEKESVYKNIFRNDLTLTVITDICIGTYISTPAEFKSDLPNTLETSSNIGGNTQIAYIGINGRDETLIFASKHDPELGNIDYSGVTDSGHKIMGLAYLNTELCKLVLDPVLWWELPKRWSLEDGATVPHAYILAYYALIVGAKTKPSETVLVHGGCSAYGLAAICIARRLGCAVFSTVTSEKQTAFLKKRFIFMNNHNIFNACNTSFEPNILMATGGEGVHVVLNCLSGNMLNATFRCVARFGKIVQLGKLDMKENTKIAMRVFLENVSLGSVEIEDIFNAPLDVKQNIQKLLSDGIKSFTVGPLYRTVVNHQDVKSVLSTLKQPEHIGKIILKASNNISPSQLNINRSSQFICCFETFYLIYGGTAEMWIDVMEWLVFRGARKLAVSSESKPEQSHLSRRFKLYQTYYELEILFMPTEAHTRKGAFELLAEISRLGPIGAVFVLPNKDCNTKALEIKAVQNLDCALQITAPKTLFINFVNNAAGICHLRAEAGFPTNNIQWDKCLEFSDVLFVLDNVIRFRVKDVFVKEEQCDNNMSESVQSLQKKLSVLLPNSISHLKEEIRKASSRPDFNFLPSLCTQTAREVPPVFIIPGMFNTNGVKELASKLMCPVFCGSFSISMFSLQTIAVLLANRMREIYPKGPYNLIGVSYGGILAYEVAKSLEKENHKTAIQFIDGAPDTIQNVLKCLGEGCYRETEYLCRILNLNDPKIIQQLTKLPNWETRLDFALNHYDSSLEEITSLKEVLTTLKKHLDEISNLQPSNNLVVGQVCLLRPVGANEYDSCGLQKYCKKDALMSIIDGDHNSILKAKKTAAFVNINIIC